MNGIIGFVKKISKTVVVRFGSNHIVFSFKHDH